MKGRQFVVVALALLPMGTLLAGLWLVGQVGSDGFHLALAADALDATPAVSAATTAPIPADLDISTRTDLAKVPPVLPGEATPADAGPADSASMGWLIECVDCPKYVGYLTGRSLRVDAAGQPHVAYGGDHLYYAWHDGATWHLETADDAPGVGSDASLALDGAGYPHISY